MSVIEQFEAMLANGQDNALLRFSLGSAYFKQGDIDKALVHLAKAIELDPQYSAAWKLYAKSLAQDQQLEAAIEAYQQGIEVAEAKGDKQVVKEMQVFLKRLLKQQAE